MDFLQYIAQNVLYIIPALNLVGAYLKTLTFLPNQAIPAVLGGLGIAATCVLLGFSVQSVVQGILCAGAAVGSHQAVKQGLQFIKGRAQGDV